MDKQIVRPPRGELFADSGARVVWAALQDLDREQWFAIYERLGKLLATAEGGAASRSPHERKVARALAAVHGAAEILAEESGVGRAEVKLGVEAYRRLRAAHPESGWPAEGSIRRWLGGSWNEVLRRAALQPVVDGDVLVREVGRAFRGEECVQAVQDYAADTGEELPVFWSYVAWARQPEVKRRPGRRPTTQHPFLRVFGSWENTLRAAGFLVEPKDADGREIQESSEPINAYLRWGRSYSAADVLDALREVAERLGHSPMSMEYVREREVIYREQREAGEVVRPLPSKSLVYMHGRWDEMLRRAGLQPTNGRYVRRSGHIGRRTYSDDQLLAALRKAQQATPGRLTLEAYADWRDAEIAAQDPDLKKPIPTASAARRRFGSWSNAVHRALDPGGGRS